jgi:hypothetical protein
MVQTVVQGKVYELLRDIISYIHCIRPSREGLPEAAQVGLHEKTYSTHTVSMQHVCMTVPACFTIEYLDCEF